MSTSIAELRKITPQIVCLGLHQGIIQSMLDYEFLTGQPKTNVLAVVAGSRKQVRFFWGEHEIILPVYPSISQLPAEIISSATTVVNVLSARRVLSTMTEVLEQLPKVKVATIFAEGVPERHALAVGKKAEGKKVLVTGPASVGLLIPEKLKLGAIGGITPLQIENAKITMAGQVAVVSTSGGMVNELIHLVTSNGQRLSFAVALGGDRFTVLDCSTAMLLAEADPQTKAILYFGELGGQDEYRIIELVKQGKLTKPILAYIAGEVAALFKEPPQFGHAKAMATQADESAKAKKRAMAEAGIKIAEAFTDLVTLVSNLPSAKVSEAKPGPAIGPRHKRLMVSRISGDVNGNVQLLGQDLLDVTNSQTFGGLVVSMLLGEIVESEKIAMFTDLVLRLLVDHGPYVSGAVNTIVSARAGKDLVSSLASGLLTIGPRFGGAVNEAARTWLDGVASGQTARDFVEGYSLHGGVIPGIGHKKYLIDLPDPRVGQLREFAENKNGDRYLKFALAVQAVTTAKKGNLILNVDGCIAAVLLDLLESELGYSQEQLRELVDAEFFNALFVLSRSVGFMAHYLDQRRNDEGLVRFDDELISYIP